VASKFKTFMEPLPGPPAVNSYILFSLAES